MLKPTEALPYGSGIPTASDIRKIRKAYPDAGLKVGTIIPFDDIAKLLDLHPKSCRFKTVTFRWRRQVESTTRRVIDAPGNKTFCVANPQEVLTLTRRKSRIATRSIMRSETLGELVNRARLSEDERGQLDHVRRRNGAMLAALQIRGGDHLATLTDERKKRTCNSTE